MQSDSFDEGNSETVCHAVKQTDRQTEVRRKGQEYGRIQFVSIGLMGRFCVAAR